MPFFYARKRTHEDLEHSLTRAREDKGSTGSSFASPSLTTIHRILASAARYRRQLGQGSHTHSRSKSMHPFFLSSTLSVHPRLSPHWPDTIPPFPINLGPANPRHATHQATMTCISSPPPCQVTKGLNQSHRPNVLRGWAKCAQERHSKRWRIPFRYGVIPVCQR